MTTPLGTLDVHERDGPPRPRRAPHARDRHHDRARPRRHRAAPTSRPGIGFYDHLLGSLAHHGLFDLEIRATGDLHVDEHHTVEDVALVLGSAFAEALGDRAGIRRFGDSSVPMDESVATAVIDVGGRPYAVIDLPFRAERAGDAAAPARGPRARVVRADRGRHAPPPRHRPQRPPPRRGRVQGARPRAARRVRAGSAADGRRVDQGLARVTRPGAAGVVVVDYGAGNLVSIEQALLAAGRARPPRADRRTTSTAPDLLVVPGVGAAAPGDGAAARAAASSSRSAPGSPPTARSSGICLGLQLLFEGSDEDGAETLGVLPGRTVRLEGAPDAAAHRLEPGRPPARRTRPSTASPTARTSTSSTRTSGAPGRRRGRRAPIARRRPSTGARSSPPSRAAGCWASSSTRSGRATTACG